MAARPRTPSDSRRRAWALLALGCACGPLACADPEESSGVDNAARCAMTPIPFFTGVQAGDGLTSLSHPGPGDAQTADYYVEWSREGWVDQDAALRLRWGLWQYYNEPTHADPLNFDWGGSRAGHALTADGDLADVRALAEWASNPSSAAGQQYWDQDDRVRTFVAYAANALLNASRCGLTVWAHSGGGVVVGAALRRLAQVPDTLAPLRGGRVRVTGLEMVFTREGRDELVAAFGAAGVTLSIRNITANSGVMCGLIEPEIRDTHRTPLITETSTESGIVDAWAIGGSHRMLAEWALSRGDPGRTDGREIANPPDCRQ